MPELPEVETMCRGIQGIVGRSLAQAEKSAQADGHQRLFFQAKLAQAHPNDDSNSTYDDTPKADSYREESLIPSPENQHDCHNQSNTHSIHDGVNSVSHAHVTEPTPAELVFVRGNIVAVDTFLHDFSSREGVKSRLDGARKQAA